MSPEIYPILIVIGFPVFFVWQRILKKRIQRKNIRVSVTLLVTLLSASLIYIIIVFSWVSIISYYPNREFNREDWFANKERRYELSKNVVESKMFIGKTKGEVRQILGDEGNSENEDHWSYTLGFRPQLFNIDPDILVIEFKDGKVVKVGRDYSGTR